MPLITAIPEVFSRAPEIVGTVRGRTDIKAFSIVMMTWLMTGWGSLNRSARASSVWACPKHRRVAPRARAKEAREVLPSRVSQVGVFF